MKIFRTPSPAPAVRRRPGWWVISAALGGLLLAVGPTTRSAGAKLAEPQGTDGSPPEQPDRDDAERSPTVADLAPAQRLHDLDFLLGNFRCEFDGNPEVGDSILYMRTRPTLGGHFYQIDITQVKPGQPDMHGRWVLGWSNPEQRFVSYYYDERVMHGSSFSPGREGNEMTFTGTYFVASKGVVEVRDEFIVHSNDHFEINEYVRIGDGEWKYFDHQDCRRLY